MTIMPQAQCFGLESPRSRIVFAVMAYGLSKGKELCFSSGSLKIELEMKTHGQVIC